VNARKTRLIDAVDRAEEQAMKPREEDYDLEFVIAAWELSG
jgi:hypothetical protein